MGPRRSTGPRWPSGSLISSPPWRAGATEGTGPLPSSCGAVAAVGGIVLALTPRVIELDDARTYALFLVVVAVGNAVIAAKGTFSPRAAS